MKRRPLNTTFVVVIIVAAVAAFPLAAVAAGQSHAPEPANGRVYGTVFDPNRAVVTDARVRIESRAARREVWTSDGGVYSAMLPAGNYSLTVYAEGFCPSRAA